MDLPTNPVIFSKFNNALAAHKQTIIVPRMTEQMDYEAELVMVIGKTAQNVSREEALNYVLGYSIGNDLSARDLQFKTPQWLLGKTCDQFAPIGPYMVTASEIDPNALNISCTVNGETNQSANTRDMIFDCATIVSYLSQYMTLKAGDLIFTGTPSGVVLGFPENERVWLKSGDVIEVEIEKLGKLSNRLESF
jgi:2-keto-4-pentenoate hydratase/2-oxohepta-3-ene-1,7-dioic acid hydratase in catechol pathway